jgi:predicted nucleic acid-binding protein
VVDASVAFGWFAEVAHSDRSVALLEAEAPLLLLAPDLVLVDLLNAGWKALRQGAITEAQFLAIGELALLPLEQLVIHLKQSHADVLCQPCGKR